MPEKRADGWVTDGPVPFRVQGQDIQTVEFLLKHKQKLVLQPGAFVCSAGGIEDIGINWGKRLRDPIIRRWSGEHAIFQEVVCETEHGWVVIGAPQIGKIVRVPVREGRSIIAQRGAYLASTGNVDVSIAFTRRMRAGFFGGQGIVFQKLSGNGDVFLHSMGNYIEKYLAEDMPLRVSTNNILAFEDTVGYDIQMVGGLLTILFGNQGLFLSKLEGPGHVVVQSVDHDAFKKSFQGGLLSKKERRSQGAGNNAQGNENS